MPRYKHGLVKRKQVVPLYYYLLAEHSDLQLTPDVNENIVHKKNPLVHGKYRTMSSG